MYAHVLITGEYTKLEVKKYCLIGFGLWLAGGYPFEPPKMQFVTKVWYASSLPVMLFEVVLMNYHPGYIMYLHM